MNSIGLKSGSQREGEAAESEIGAVRDEECGTTPNPAAVSVGTSSPPAAPPASVP
ncbi:hypothetical protein A2U01_0098884 [Trifolium medium]|nr:hypothetical protein [Trifolium medium]